MRFLLLLVLAPLVLLKGLLWLVFVPLTRVLMRLINSAGVLRMPLLVLTFPICAVGIILDGSPTGGRLLEGDVIRPTFTLPFAFRRGPWRVRQEDDVRRALLELGDEASPSTLEITVSDTFAALRASDAFTARVLDRALAEPALPNGMRWAGMRIHSFVGAPLSCLYFVWKDGAPHSRVIHVKFTGDPAHEEAADAFVRSVLPQLPEEDSPAPTLADQPA